MSRLFQFSGLFFLFSALALSFLVSVSLPYLPALDITRVHFNQTVQQEGTTGVQELRLGIWAPCSYNPSGDRTCLQNGHGYSVRITITNSAKNELDTVVIHSAWTRGLAVHPVATGITAVALLFSVSSHLTLLLVGSILSFLAATVTLIAFAIDIALFALVKNAFSDMNISVKTVTGPGFWLTFASVILLLLAGCTVCFRRRKISPGTKSSPTFFSRFRRRRN